MDIIDAIFIIIGTGLIIAVGEIRSHVDETKKELIKEFEKELNKKLDGINKELNKKLDGINDNLIILGDRLSVIEKWLEDLSNEK
jgi:hypothetical protein